MGNETNYKKVIEILTAGGYNEKKLVAEIAKSNPGVLLKAYYRIHEKNSGFSGIRGLLKAERKVEAIKEHKSIFGSDLRTAKEAVDKIQEEMKLNGELK